MKKMKLLMSLSMLCLSIAMLCFGVFAASSVTYTISGTISYQVSEVFCKITCDVYRTSKETASAALKTAADNIASTGTVSSYTKATSGTTCQTSGSETTNPYTANSGNLAIQFGTVGSDTWYTYYIVLTIENLADKDFNATLGTVTTATGTINYQSANVTGIEKGKAIARRIVIGCALSDKLTSITGGSLSATLTIAYPAS